MIFRKATVYDFDKIFEIMEQSFPRDERRPQAAQKALFDNGKFSAYVMCDNDGIIGFVTTWQLVGFAFVEHLAVSPDHRNLGLGAKILSELSTSQNARLCLEVEPPQTDIARRRIAFYERNGFYLNHFDYVQPAYTKQRNPVPLLIMTTDGAINAQEFENVKEQLYREVYRVDA